MFYMLLAPHYLRTNALRSPLGIDSLRPEFSWSPSSDAEAFIQAGYAIQVATEPTFGAGLLWDSRRQPSERPYGVIYGGPDLVSCTRYYWRVKVWSTTNSESPWSEPTWFETGVLNAALWQAKWIGFGDVKRATDRRCLYLRTDFDLAQKVVRARAYVSALGWYKLVVNGNNLTGSALVPRWTPLDLCVEYQTYDVTDQLRRGKNVLGIVVADGRYRGRLGFRDVRNVYGDRLAGFAQLMLELEDGSTRTISTDGDWLSGEGRIAASCPKEGEQVDLRIPDDDWMQARPPVHFRAPSVLPAHPRRLIAEEVGRVEEVARLEPVQISRTASGRQLIDFGQNFAGVVRIRLKGRKGDKVHLTHSEVLQPDGEVDLHYLDNPFLRIKVPPARDEVTLNGATEWFQPWFTIHGFRYLEVDGVKDTINVKDVQGIVLSSALEEAGGFDCSDEQINQLHQNVVWSLRSNFVDTPTDCPTRERSGWTGDIQVFAPTAMGLVDVQAYLRRYLRNVRMEQQVDGRIPVFIPSESSAHSGGLSWLMRSLAGAIGWGDVTVFTPNDMNLHYGDETVFADQYESMKRWVDFLADRARSRKGHSRWFARSIGELEQYVLDSGMHFGEWLRPGEGIIQMLKPILFSPAVVATAYLAQSARLLSQVAERLGNADDAIHYEGLAAKVREAWNEAFVRNDGRIGSDKQDDYVRALAFDLLPENKRDAAFQRLVALIEKANFHIGTGFLSTAMLLPLLTSNGRADLAYKLLQQTSPPSWLGQVMRGATTIWETWEGYRPDGQAFASHNHYALGAATRWLTSGVAGISAAEPGFRRINIAPQIGGGLTHARAWLRTPYGTVRSAWRVVGDDVHLEVEVPAGAEAKVATQQIDFHVGSGRHAFNWSLSSYSSGQRQQASEHLPQTMIKAE